MKCDTIFNSLVPMHLSLLNTDISVLISMMWLWSAGLHRYRQPHHKRMNSGRKQIWLPQIKTAYWKYLFFSIKDKCMCMHMYVFQIDVSIIKWPLFVTFVQDIIYCPLLSLLYRWVYMKSFQLQRLIYPEPHWFSCTQSHLGATVGEYLLLILICETISTSNIVK